MHELSRRDVIRVYNKFVVKLSFLYFFRVTVHYVSIAEL
uniref:Uncharacterized protein n=1 Tax=Rhizophora mucronata TaxID=61149 RepID=A0A2P2KNN0_RHIMU